MKPMTKIQILILLLLMLAIDVMGQGSHVFTGAQSISFGNVNLGASTSWTSFRGAIPGYWSALSNASYIGGADNHNIDGYMKHYANATDQAFTFPVGSGTDLRVLSISGTRSATSIIGTAWILGDPSISVDPTAPNAGPHDITNVSAPIVAVSPVGQWDWQDVSNDAAGLTVTVSIPDMTSFSTTDSLRLVGWNGTLWVDLSEGPSATGNTENSSLSGTMQLGITALGIGKGEVFTTEPDMHSSLINLTVNGDVNTNDYVANGTTYGTPTAFLSNPSGAVLSMNTDGTYTFSSPTPGEYNYMVPVCPLGVTTGCPTELLTITVLDGADLTTAPTTNPDVASTLQNNAVTINVLSNDQCNNGVACALSNPTIIVGPNHGSVSVNAAGAIIYTPLATFVGKDSILYSTCDNQAIPICDTEYIVITVLPTGSPNTTNANDDYEVTPATAAVIGNVLDNDSDPENDVQSVTPQTVVTAQGTFILDSTGAYSFTPTPQAVGTVRFIYNIKDNNSAALATDTGTLVIIIRDNEWQTTIDFNTTITSQTVSGNVRTNDLVPSTAVYGTPTPVMGNPSGGVINMDSSGVYTFNSATPGVYNYMVPVCPPESSQNCVTELLTITVIDPVDSTEPPIVHPDAAATVQNIPVTLNVLSNDACNKGVQCVLSNPSLLTAPSFGTALVDPNGDITYTPAIGFVGTDSVLYSVCDNQSPAQKCDTAYAVFHVLPTGGPNTTFANDDYAYMDDYNALAIRNALDNDTDPESHTKYAATQNVNLPEGDFILNTDGTYTFEPSIGFTGPVDIVYGIYDNGTPVAFDVATIHILVNTTQTPLPLDLVRFKASEKNCEAHISWQTTNEKNVSYFEIQRKDAQGTYETIEQVAAIGYTITNKEYSYIDRTAKREQQGYIYRLKMMDMDGQYAYSAERTLNMSCTNNGPKLTISPNPTSNILTLMASELSVKDYEQLTLSIYNNLGQVVRATNVMAEAGNLYYTINVFSLAQGAYIIHISNMSNTYEHNIKFLKE